MARGAGDFGLARATLGPASDPGTAPTPLSSDMTETGAFLGTPAYAAPEQIAGLDSDALADQFAFCVATWEALDAEALAIVDDIMPRMHKLPSSTAQVMGSMRFMQAQALWRRDRADDRDRAHALAVQARADMVTHRDQFDAATGLGALYHRSANRLIARIDDWQAARVR